MLTDGRTDGRKVITIAHPEQSSGELKINPTGSGEDLEKPLELYCIWSTVVLTIHIDMMNDDEYDSVKARSSRSLDTH